ncbi:MAG TPA: FecR domain-containing protein [Bryobacteraceae bacterium]|nr:FecR domain-containing protein [Bryobacteraceae bacterium]
MRLGIFGRFLVVYFQYWAKDEEVTVRRTAGKAILFLVMGTASFVARGEDIVGSIKTAQGGVIIHRDEQSIPASEGFHLQLNDTVQTSADGRVGMILQDGTRISLGPATEMRLDRFVYQPADGKFGLLLRLSRGLLTYISGKIAQFSSGSVSVETPAGVLGLRGTHFAILIEGT